MIEEIDRRASADAGNVGIMGERPCDTGRDREGICPICGGDIVYTGLMDLVDDGATYPWQCAVCGATGKEGYDLKFDRHYSVQDARGDAVPGRSGAEGILSRAEKIRINAHGGPLPVSHGEWIDLYTAEEVTMDPLEHRLISLGVSMELPAGYYAHMVPRSSTCKNWGVIQANSVGIFENSFCGDGDVWMFPAVAIRRTTIPKGARICQFRLVRCAEAVEFEEVERLGDPDRGGWGSTGT